MIGPWIRGSWSAAVLLLTLAGVAVYAASRPAESPAVVPTQTEGKQDRVKELLQERLTTCREMVRQVETRYKNGQCTYDEVHSAARMTLDAELEVCTTDKERVAVLEKFLPEAKRHEQTAETFFKSGQGTMTTALKARADRLRVEIDLERARARAK